CGIGPIGDHKLKLRGSAGPLLPICDQPIPVGTLHVVMIRLTRDVKRLPGAEALAMKGDRRRRRKPRAVLLPDTNPRYFLVKRRPRLANLTDYAELDFGDYERRLASLQSVLQLIGGGNERLLVPSADWVVTPNPVGVAVHAAGARGDRLLLRRAVAHVLEASIGEGQPLHPMHARDADAAEMRKGLDRIAARLEPTRQDVGVLERLAGALTGIRQHRMRGVADELDATAAPILRQRPRKEAPF